MTDSKLMVGDRRKGRKAGLPKGRRTSRVIDCGDGFMMHTCIGIIYETYIQYIHIKTSNCRLKIDALYYMSIQLQQSHFVRKGKGHLSSLP